MATENQTLSKALGTDMIPAPFKEPDYSKIRTLPQVLSEEQRIGNLQAEAAGELKKAELTQQANLAGEQAKAATEIASKARTYVDDSRQKEAEFPFPEFHPTKDNAESLAGLFSIVSTLGIMLGSSGKQSGINAMNAMSGMMNGWQKGRADLFKREKEEFDKEFNRIKVLRESLRKDLEDYMKLLPYDKEAAMYKAAEISAKTGSDSIINAYVKKGQADKALSLLQSAEKMIQHREDKELQIQLEKLRAGLKQQKDALPMVQGIRGIENLQRQLADPDVQKGLLSKTAPWIEKLKSIRDSTDYFDSAVNKELTGTDKTTLFLKDALLETYAIERAAKGGQRLSVQDMKMVGPVLDPTNYSPQTYNALLEGRRKVLYDNLQDLGYNLQQIKTATAPRTYEAYEKGASAPKYSLGQEITYGNKKYKVIGLTNPDDPDLEEVK